MTLALVLAIPLPLTLQAFTLRRECRKADSQATGVRLRLQSMTSATGEMDAKISLWTQLTQSQQARRAWEAMLPSLAACLPDDVSLQQVEISHKDNGSEVQMQGNARTMAALRTFTSALSRTVTFAHLHLDETTAGPNGISFQITGSATGVIVSAVAPTVS